MAEEEKESEFEIEIKMRAVGKDTVPNMKKHLQHMLIYAYEFKDVEIKVKRVK